MRRAHPRVPALLSWLCLGAVLILLAPPTALAAQGDTVGVIIPHPFGQLLRLSGSPRVAAGDTLIGRIGVISAGDSATLVGAGTGVPASPDSVRVETFNALDYNHYISNKLLSGYTTVSAAALDASSVAAPMVLGMGNNGVYYSPTGLRAHGGKPAAVRVYGTVQLLVSGPADFKSDLIVTRGNASAALILIANDAGGISFSSISAEAGMPVLVMTPGELRIAKASHLGAVAIAAGGLTLGRDVYLRFDHVVMDPFLALLQGGIIGGIPGGPPSSPLWGDSRAGGGGKGGPRPQSVALAGGYDFRKLANLRGGVHLSLADSLHGQIVVPDSADSAALVDYVAGAPIPPDSVQVAIHDTPDFTRYIQNKITGGYQTITSSNIAASSVASPLVLGLGNNGIYYAPTGLSVPGGQASALKVYGPVMILTSGQIVFSKDLAIVAGDATASLLFVADAAGMSGFTCNKISSPQVPLLVWTQGDANFKKANANPNVSIFASSLYLAKDQSFAYQHLVMDPVIDYYANGNAVSAVAPPGPAPVHEPARLSLNLMRNPARTTVGFQLALPRAGKVSLDIFDVGGRRVRHLEPGRLSAGIHPIVWDGRLSGGERAASGAYFARLSAPGGAVTKRFVLIR